jgi:hypothetical protein
MVVREAILPSCMMLNEAEMAVAAATAEMEAMVAPGGPAAPAVMGETWPSI